MIVKLLTEHHLEFLSCRGSSESTLVKLLEITCGGSFYTSRELHKQSRGLCIKRLKKNRLKAKNISFMM